MVNGMPCFSVFEMSCNRLMRLCSHYGFQSYTRYTSAIDSVRILDAYIHPFVPFC